MYWIHEKNEEDLRRNTLSIRFTDAEHKLVCNAAWKKRISASGMIRAILLNGLEERGLNIAESQHIKKEAKAK
jgi:hypothetical protein